MVVQLSLVVNLGETSNGVYSALLPIPGISPDVSLVLDLHVRRWSIEWTNVPQRIHVAHGRIELKFSTQTQFAVDVEGLFPPTRCGGLSSTSPFYAHSLSSLAVTIVLNEGPYALSRLAASEEALKETRERLLVAEARAKGAEAAERIMTAGYDIIRKQSEAARRRYASTFSGPPSFPPSVLS